MSCQTAAMDNATEVPGLTQGRCLDNSQPFSSNVRGAAWALEFTIKTIGKLGEKKEFKTRTARKIIQRIPDLLIEELGIELEEVYLSMLLDCSLGIDPSQATRLYNERIPRVLVAFVHSMRDAVWSTVIAQPVSWRGGPSARIRAVQGYSSYRVPATAFVRRSVEKACETDVPGSDENPHEGAVIPEC